MLVYVEKNDLNSSDAHTHICNDTLKQTHTGCDKGLDDLNCHSIDELA